MLKRLWADHRNACLLTLALVVVGVVVTPWVLVAAVVPIGWVLLNNQPAAEDQPLTITEEDKIPQTVAYLQNDISFAKQDYELPFQDPKAAILSLIEEYEGYSEAAPYLSTELGSELCYIGIDDSGLANDEIETRDKQFFGEDGDEVDFIQKVEILEPFLKRELPKHWTMEIDYSSHVDYDKVRISVSHQYGHASRYFDPKIHPVNLKIDFLTEQILYLKDVIYEPSDGTELFELDVTSSDSSEPEIIITPGRDILYLGRKAKEQYFSLNDIEEAAYYISSLQIDADRELVLAAVQSDGSELKYAADELKADREVVLAAVQSDGDALQYAADELKADREVVLAAVMQDGSALKYANVKFRSDREVILAAVKRSGDALQYADESLKADREVVLAAVQSSGAALKYAAEKFRSEREVVLAAVQSNGDAFKYAAEKFRSDRDVVLAAVQSNGDALKYANEKLIAELREEGLLEDN